MLDLFIHTLQALLKPRRLIPILAVGVPLVWAEVAFGNSLIESLFAGSMLVAFVVVGPFSWRALFPLNKPIEHRPLRLLAYLVVSFLCTFSVSFILPRVFGLPLNFLASLEASLVTMTMYWVGAWGLGRDIEMEAKTHALERAKERAELMALRSHLDPHFLFNTLNAIAEWCREDGEVAERAVLTLSDMLRTVLRGVKADKWSLDEELDLVRTLFQLHLLRDPELFDLVENVPPEVPEIGVPPMIFLPIAENAMKHGPAAGHRGELTMSVVVDGSALTFALENPGAYTGRRAGGEGLSMVERRLALRSPPGRLAIEDTGDRTRVTLTLPR